MLPCSPAGACIGNNECYDGYTGYMCASCSRNYYKGEDAECISCGASQSVILYCILVGLVVVPLYLIAAGVDGNKHDARFGLASIAITWCQYAALFSRVEIPWTSLSPGGPALEALKIPTSITIVKVRPECALTVTVREYCDMSS